jgi:tetratricopeptide (TPR) repeat protein
LRYRLDQDGWFTYDEWVRRFIGFRYDLRCYSGHWHTFKSDDDRARGEADLRGALADEPGNGQARFYLAANLHGTGRAAEALTEMEAALADADVAADPRASALHAGILFDLKRFAESASAARIAVKFMPQAAAYHRLLGRALREDGHSADALEAFREAVELDPFDGRNWLELEFELLRANDMEAATPCFVRSLALKPDDGPTLRHLSTIYDRRRDFDSALPLARRAVAIDRNNAVSLRRLGEIALRAGLPEEAEAALRSATTIAVADRFAWHGLGVALFRLGRLAEADEAMRAALAFDDRNPHFNFQAGEIRASLGQNAAAREFFRKASALAPDNAVMRSRLEAMVSQED